MRLYIIRHGETQWNKQGRIQGKLDTDLTPDGVQQAKNVAKRLKTVRFDAAYSSPLKRARDTAEYILAEQQQPLQLHFDDTLMELGYGAWQGLSFAQVMERDPENWFLNRYSPSLMHIEGADSVVERVAQARTFVQSIYAQYPNGTVLITSHAFAIRILMAACMGLPIEATRFYAFGNTSVSIMDLTDKGPRLVLMGDVHHNEEAVQYE